VNNSKYFSKYLRYFYLASGSIAVTSVRYQMVLYFLACEYYYR